MKIRLLLKENINLLIQDLRAGLEDWNAQEIKSWFLKNQEAIRDNALIIKNYGIEREYYEGMPYFAFYFANLIEGPNDDTRIVASQNHEYAFYYALHVDEKPHETTREGANQNPHFALHYLVKVDKEKLYDSSLRSILKHPSTAYELARRVTGPTEETREAASKRPWTAANYAIYIDRGPHKVTHAGAKKDVSAFEYYLNHMSAKQNQ